MQQVAKGVHKGCEHFKRSAMLALRMSKKTPEYAVIASLQLLHVNDVNILQNDFHKLQNCILSLKEGGMNDVA